VRISDIYPTVRQAEGRPPLLALGAGAFDVARVN
jgi:hypothetical protein